MSNLSKACLDNNIYEVRRLLGLGVVDPNEKDTDGFTPLMRAVIEGHLEIASLLVDGGAKIEAKDKFGCTPLMVAVMKGHLAAVSVLIDRGADIEVKDKDGDTALMVAATEGHLAVASLLIDRGANIEAKDRYGCTPLMVAAIYGDLTVASHLIDRGANMEAKDWYGYTPLMRAAIKGKLAAVTLLVDRGADKEAKDRRGCTPLMRAILKGHLAIVSLLIDRGANMEVKYADGSIPLVKALRLQRMEIAYILLESGPDNSNKNEVARLAVKNAHAKEFFHFLCKNGLWKSVGILLRAEAYLMAKKGGGCILSNQRDPDGNLAIFIALQSNVCTMEIIIALLEAHAQLTPTDFDRIESFIRSSLDSPPVLNFDNFQVLCGMLSNQSKLITVNLHLCGPSHAGKTSIKKCLESCLPKRPSPIRNTLWPTAIGHTDSTVGMELSRIQYENMCWVINDYGGRKIYHVNHSTHLAAPNSIYVVVLATSVFEDTAGGKLKGTKFTIDEISQNYDYWLKFINSTAAPSSTIHCITVVNFDSAILEKEKLRTEIEKVQQKFTKSGSLQTDSEAFAHTIKFCGDLLFVHGNRPGTVEKYLNPLLHAVVASIDVNPLPSIRLVDLVKESLNSSGVKAMPTHSFRDLIQKLILKEYKFADGEVVRLLTDSVVKNMCCRGEIFVDNISEVEVPQETEWMVIDVNWLTRDILGTILFNLNENDKINGNKQLNDSKLTSIDLDELTKTKNSNVTAKSYFGGDESVLPKLLHCIGARIRMIDNTVDDAQSSEKHQNWFPIFSMNHPGPDQCQLLNPFRQSKCSRLIVRRFQVREADTVFFPPGYFPKLFVSVASLFQEKFVNMEVLESAIDIRFVEATGEQIQVMIRSNGDCFYVIVISLKDFAHITSNAWHYYLEIVSLFNCTSNMLTKESAHNYWYHSNIVLDEVCCNPQSILATGETFEFMLPFQSIESVTDWLKLSEIEMEIDQDDQIRHQRLVYLYGLNENGTHADDEDAYQHDEKNRQNGQFWEVKEF
mmetsp:Transcript_2476/g.3375  ORF Transcript_2476/g.3375 Transcript_2476/m.3375 type:complete len:1019 (-) Transcript_2476:403-3459(-)